MRKMIIAMMLTMGLSALSAGAATLAYWDFGPDASGYTENVTKDSVIGTPTLTISGTDKDDDGQSGNAYTDDDGAFHDAGQAAAWTSGANEGDDQWLMTINLSSVTGPAWLGFEYRSTGSGPTSADLSYNIGAGWVAWDTGISLNNNSSFNSYSIALDGAMLGESNVQILFDNFLNGTGSGTFRNDNIEVWDDTDPPVAAPEPGTASLIVCAFGIIAIARKKFAKLS